MTEKQTALKVYVLWAWLETHPGCDKDEYPLFLDLHIDRLHLECPWCELHNRYDGYAKNGDCTGCPLVELVNEECAYSGSWYARWEENLPYQTGYSVEAGNIAALAWQEYKRLGG